MGKEKLPIKFFAHRVIDELRVEGGGSSEIPKWILAGDRLKFHAEILMNSLNDIEKEMEKHIKEESVIPFVFTVKTGKDATAKSKRHYVSNFFQNTSTDKKIDKIIGLTNTNELIVRVDTIQELKEIKNQLKNYEANNYAISCLENFGTFLPLFSTVKEYCNYKVKLIDFQNYEQNLMIRRLLENTLKHMNVKFSITKYSEDLIVYKLNQMNNTSLDALKKQDIYNGVFSIEPIPKYSVSFDSIEKDAKTRILIPDKTKDYITIGILDSGISNIPHLSEWLEPERWSPYPESSITPNHGTFVAGVALYGDVLEGKEWVGHKGVKLFDAAIFPDTSKEGIDEDELVVNITEAIKRYHEKVKIWNLSISVTNEVQDFKFSDFGIALDSLHDKYNVLICKSAGNCDNFLNHKPKGRIYEGADSIRSLVVGSMAHDKGKNDYAEINDPSPFSRIGPGPEFIIKPEVSHYGGNAGLDAHNKMTKTGVISFAMDGSLSKSIGTSFSTPRITSLAAGIQQELNEDFDPLLLKSLIIHSASYPKEMTVPTNERTKEIGYGIPKNVSDIIYNSSHEATLILRDNLQKGEIIDIMDFPMPECLIKNGFFTGQVIATLVYDPILDPSQGIEYCQSNIDFKFGTYDERFERDTTLKTILNPVGRRGAQNLLLGNVFSKTKMKGKSDVFALKERLLIQYGDKYYPVKKYAIDLAELTDKKKIDYLTSDKKWYLYLRGIYRDHLERKSVLEARQLSQEFCLIITIRDPNNSENVYDAVSQKLEEYNFWYSNIKINTGINVSV